MTVERFFTSPLGIVAAASGAMLLWGSSFPFTKLSYEALGIAQEDVYKQILFAGYRFFLASLLVLVMMLLLRKKFSYPVASIKGILPIALCQTFLQYLCLHIGLSISTGIQASIIAGTTSFFQIIFAHFMYNNDRLSVRKLVGLTIGFMGVILVSYSKGEGELSFGIGEVILLLGMASAALGNILAKKKSAQIDVFFITAGQMCLGSTTLILIGASQVGFAPFSFTWSATLMLLYLSSLAAVAFLLWNTVMKYNQVGSISTYMFLIPVFGVVFSSVLLQEQVHGFIIYALLLVVTGIIIVNTSYKQKHLLKKGLADHG